MICVKSTMSEKNSVTSLRAPPSCIGVPVSISFSTSPRGTNRENVSVTVRILETDRPRSSISRISDCTGGRPGFDALNPVGLDGQLLQRPRQQRAYE